MTADHTYTAATSDDMQLPAPVRAYFDGEDLLDKVQAARLSTVDVAGWPRAALLSAGDILAVAPDRIRLAVFAQSTVAANLARDNLLTLSIVLDRTLYEVRFTVRRLQQSPAVAVPLAAASSIRPASLAATRMTGTTTMSKMSACIACR